MSERIESQESATTPNPYAAPGRVDEAPPKVDDLPSRGGTAYVGLIGRFRLALAAFALRFVLDVMNVIATGTDLMLLGRLANGELVLDAEWRANEILQQTIGVGMIAAFFGTVVTFLIWFYRARKNLPTLGARPSELKHSPAMAVGSFFVPILNLFLPCLAMQEVWRHSDARAAPSAGRASVLVLAWWASWLALNVGSQVSAQFNLALVPDSNLNMFMIGDVMNLATSALSMVATVLVVAVIHRITHHQESRRARLIALHAEPFASAATET